MNRIKLQKLLTLSLLVCMALVLCACSRLAAIELPPLPTPRHEQTTPAFDVFAQTSAPQSSAPAQESIPELPVTPPPTPSPSPTPTPEPTEDPNIPRLFIENETYPENMNPYTSVNLLGEIWTNKGVIAMVWGRIVDADGNIVQNCKFYPYTDTFSLAGTVNAEIRFASLEPGHYAYVVSAVAEFNSYSSGEVVLIEHPFEVYYP